jgi:class 3 adenylate cyclase
MKGIFRFSALLLIIISLTRPSYAQQQIVLSDSKKFYRHENAFLYLDDRQCRFSAADLSNPAFLDSFKPAEASKFNFGLTESAIWYRFTLKNETGDKWLLQAGNPTVQEIALYAPHPHGTLDSVHLSLAQKISQRQWKNNNFFITLPFVDSNRQTYFLRITGYHAMNIPPVIATEQSFFERNHTQDVWQGAYLGFILVMVLYNFFIFLSVRDRSYLYYILYITCIGIVVSMHNGYPFNMLWPNFPQLNDYIDVLTSLSGIFALLFTADFLHIRSNAPRTYKALVAIIVLYVLAGIVVLLHMPLLGARIEQIISLFGGLFVFFAVVYIYRSGYAPAKFYLIAWSVLITGMVLFILGDMGVIDTRSMDIDYLQIGSAGEALLLSFALANRINIYKKEKEEAQLKSIEALTENEKLVREQNVVLEEKVKQRTIELVHRSTELEIEKRKSDELLLNILPEEVAAELKEKGVSEARLYTEVSVLFTDFINFTGISEQLSPKELVHEIGEYFKAIDEIVERHNLEKIKTIGDAYLAVSGLPNADNAHAENAVRAALEIGAYIEKRKQEGGLFDIRTGINSGPVVAGIVGIKKFAYDIWGDTVNIAARMEQNGEPGKVNISHATYLMVKDKFKCEYRGEIEAKNKGKLKMYFVH